MKGVSTAKARVPVGTYAGDGAATQAITGVGFRADFVLVGPMSGTYDSFFKTAAMGLNAKNTASAGYVVNAIVSIDADGFTVALAQGLNAAATDYAYLALKN